MFMVPDAWVRKRQWLWHCRQNASQLQVEGVSRERRASKDWENNGGAKEDCTEVQLGPLYTPILSSCGPSHNHTADAPRDLEVYLPLMFPIIFVLGLAGNKKPEASLALSPPESACYEYQVSFSGAYITPWNTTYLLTVSTCLECKDVWSRDLMRNVFLILCPQYLVHAWTQQVFQKNEEIRDFNHM